MTTVSGQIRTVAGTGINGATVKLMDASGAVIAQALSSSLGYYSLDVPDDIESGILTVTHKVYRFSPQSIVIRHNFTASE